MEVHAEAIAPADPGRPLRVERAGSSFYTRKLLHVETIHLLDGAQMSGVCGDFSFR